MAGNVVEFTDQSFEQEVLKATTPVLVDFWAVWCGPCRMIAPTVEALANDYVGKAKIGKLNVDDHSSIPQRYGIRSIPTLLLFKDGQVAEQLVGAQSREAIEGIIKKHLA